MATAVADRPKTTTWGGSITLPPRCKPSKVCSPDRTRPILCHAYLRRRDDGMWLFATDSYIAVAVKVDGTADEGYIPIGALRHLEAGQDGKQLSATAWRVKTRDGLVTHDIADKIDGTVPFPDLEALGLFGGATRAESLPSQFEDGKPLALGINPRLMSRINDGLGARHGCRFEIVAPMKPIRVFALDGDDRVGIQMPIRLNA